MAIRHDRKGHKRYFGQLMRDLCERAGHVIIRGYDNQGAETPAFRPALRLHRVAERIEGAVEIDAAAHPARELDRKSTRLNFSHVEISYAVFCLKKKKKK